jgi:hypothetical protein
MKELYFNEKREPLIPSPELHINPRKYSAIAYVLNHEMTRRSLTQTDGRTTRINFPATIPLLLLPYQPVPQTVPNYDYSYKQLISLRKALSCERKNYEQYLKN